ncbi:MAG: hypothetical protein AAGK14_11580 [Verrucomicrobiota bacterium]
MTTTPDNAYLHSLDRLLRQWQRGLLVCAVLNVLGVLLLTLLVYGVLDYFLALNEPVRWVISLGVLAAMLILCVVRFSQVLVKGRREVAAFADELQADRRHRLLGTLELQHELAEAKASDPGGFRAYLLHRELGQAGVHLARAEQRGVWPREQFGATLKAFAVQAGIVLVVAALNLAGAGTVTMRMLMPWADVPPSSPYTFHVTPGAPSVIYGDDLEISAQIEGGAVEDPVYLVTRRDGVLHRTPSFHSGQGAYSQRLENITSPVAFCFSTGTARSRWHEVQVRYIPRVVMTGVTVYPPAYLQKPSQTMFLGEEKLKAIVGSKVRLAVTSNRPLAGGTLTITPAGEEGGPVQTVKATNAGIHSVQFEWTVQEDAELEIEVEDILGTRNEEPYRVAQSARPDEPPAVTISTPRPFVLATPSTRIPVEASAEDDFGLRRVSYVRKVVGFRDRAKLLAENLPQPRYGFQGEVDLARQGVQPGDELELFLEASDHNPSLLGTGVSGMVRIQVISEEEYAERIRAQTTIDEFLRRYEILNEALRQQQEKAAELAEMVRDPNASDEQLQQKLDALRRQNEAVQELFKRIAEDFPAFATDPELNETAEQVAERLEQTGQGMAQATVSNREDLERVMRKMAPQLEEAQRRMQRANEVAEIVQEVRALMENASGFARLYERQSQLERQSERFSNPSISHSERELRAMAGLQERIRIELDELAEKIKLDATALGSEHQELKESAFEFYNRMQDLQISEAMQAGVEAGRSLDGRGLHLQAATARTKMEELISECSGGGFGGMCEGCIRFQIKRSGGGATTAQALAQLLGALLGQGGTGSGGGGPGGLGGSGYWAQGKSMLNVPVYGPARTSFSTSNIRSLMADGPASGGAGRQTEMEVVENTVTAAEKTESERFPQEMIPERYRDAVRHFYSQPESQPDALPTP